MKNTVLVTGAAGFIGSHLSEKLVHLDYEVIGLDNFDEFYSPDIKRQNISCLAKARNFQLVTGDIRDANLLREVFQKGDINVVVHLAARAGVRPSIDKPLEYIDVNINGTVCLLEASRKYGVKQFIFASSSSVYGIDSEMPFREDSIIRSPASPYATSKAAAELYCQTYSYLYKIPIKVLRFFTVYGPRQRPEMAIHQFVRKIDSGEEITIFGDGTSKRDYTYISDIINGIIDTMKYTDEENFSIFNLGNYRPITLEYLISLIEKNMKKSAKLTHLPVQAGDVPVTVADISKARNNIDYRPEVPIEQGIPLFIEWYLKNKEALV
jgi:UDP-glucuronate 4-epimerase